MLIYPAIDLRHGKCVRLQQGKRHRETIYSDDPFATAAAFIAEGATWLHLIDLDGAFAEASVNRGLVKHMANSFSVRIQSGGGIRTLDHMAELFDAGVARVVLGTVAVRHPEVVRLALEKFGPKRIAVAIDARDGRIAMEGWESSSSVEALEFAKQLDADGVELAIYTDIARDGMLCGINLSALQTFLDETNLHLIASGGVRDLNDLKLMRNLRHPRLNGAILGRSLYEGTIQLGDAIEIFQAEKS